MWRLENWLYRIYFRNENKLYETRIWKILTWNSSVAITDRCFRQLQEKFEKNPESYLSGEEFREDYMCFARSLLRHGFKIKGHTNWLVENLGEGNWQHLWETEEEKQEDTAKIFDDMTSDMLYCSDRWSWDRFLRINWQFQRIKRRTM